MQKDSRSVHWQKWKESSAKVKSWPSDGNVYTRSARAEFFWKNTPRSATVENSKDVIEHQVVKELFRNKP